MGAISPLHLILILVVALLVLGPGKLPETGAALGRAIREFRDAVEGRGEDASRSATGAPGQSEASREAVTPPAGAAAPGTEAVVPPDGAVVPPNDVVVPPDEAAPR